MAIHSYALAGKQPRQMAVAVVGDMEVVGLEPCRRELDWKLQEATERTLKAACWPITSRHSQVRAEESALDVTPLGEMCGELLGSKVHTRPFLLQKVGDDRDPRQSAVHVRAHTQPLRLASAQ